MKICDSKEINGYWENETETPKLDPIGDFHFPCKDRNESSIMPRLAVHNGRVRGEGREGEGRVQRKAFSFGFSNFPLVPQL